MSNVDHHTLRLGTRGSLLARAQSQMIADALEQLHPGLGVDLVIVKTSGDRITDRPLYDEGGKGLFTKELEQALLAGEIDFAVHSFKDVPVTMPLVAQDNLIFAAVPQREDPRDVLISVGAKSIAELANGAKVGTSSLRRKARLLDRRADLRIEPIRGNIDSRIRKVRDGEFDATILALAGLKRSGLFDAATMKILEVDEMLPAAAQAALALQCRRDDDKTSSLLSPLNDPTSEQCVGLERALVGRLNGDCHSPIAVLAERTAMGSFAMQAAVGARDGNPPLLRASGSAEDAKAVLEKVYGELDRKGVQEHLSTGR